MSDILASLSHAAYSSDCNWFKGSVSQEAAWSFGDNAFAASIRFVESEPCRLVVWSSHLARERAFGAFANGRETSSGGRRGQAFQGLGILSAVQSVFVVVSGLFGYLQPPGDFCVRIPPLQRQRIQLPPAGTDATTFRVD